MRPDPERLSGRLVLSLGGWLVRLLIRLFSLTWRVRIHRGEEHLRSLQVSPRPVILSFWHNRAFPCAPFLLREFLGRDLPVTLLASQSRDGELVVNVAKPWNFNVVRGSATRGGRQALRTIYRSIVKDGTSPVMVPDGPVGPIYEFKVGVLVLAQMSKAPILGLGLAADRYWRLGSWDRLILPKPFARIAVTLSEPQGIPKGLTAEETEAERLRLQELLDELTLEAEAEVGTHDDARTITAGSP